MNISYVTGNTNKFLNAKDFFEKYNITITQQALKINEIQASDSIQIAIDKAEQAWAQTQMPLFVNDATWEIPVLKGFPGPYMKYINQWFDPDDFINLMQGKDDRRIILKDIIVFINKTGHTVFTNNHEGVILTKKAIGAYRHPSDLVISLSKNKLSIAEEVANGSFFIEGEDVVWKEFADWLIKTGETKI